MAFLIQWYKIQSWIYTTSQLLLPQLPYMFVSLRCELELQPSEGRDCTDTNRGSLKGELAGWKHLPAMVLSHVCLGQEAKTAFRPEVLSLLWKDYGKGSLGHASAQWLATFTSTCIIKQLTLTWQKLHIWHIINWGLPKWAAATGWRGRGSQLSA